MTIFSSIRLLIGLDLAQKGLSSDIISPILNILKLADEEMTMVGYDFENPEIMVELEKLESAITEMHSQESNSDSDSAIHNPTSITPFAYNLEGNETVEYEQRNNFGNVIELGFTEDTTKPSVSAILNDPLSYLDDDDGN
jgi:hypothetical protein